MKIYDNNDGRLKNKKTRTFHDGVSNTCSSFKSYWNCFMPGITVSLRDDTHIASMKISNFQDPPPLPLCPSKSKIPSPPWPWTLNFKRTPPLQMMPNQLKENIIQGWLLYVIRSFLQVGFRFEYQLINLVWLSFDFFSFNWSLTICFFVACLYSCVSNCLKMSRNIFYL